jgi:hypothetical protein
MMNSSHMKEESVISTLSASAFQWGNEVDILSNIVAFKSAEYMHASSAHKYRAYRNGPCFLMPLKST